MDRRCDKCNLDVSHGTVLKTLCIDGAAHHLVHHEGIIDRYCNKCNLEVPSGEVVESVCVDGSAHCLMEIVNRPTKLHRMCVDCSRELALDICAPFESTILADMRGLRAALLSPLSSAIPIDRFVQEYSAMRVNGTFQSTPGREAVEFVRAFDCFEMRYQEVKKRATEKSVRCAITTLTDALWRKLAALVHMQPELTYNYEGKDTSEVKIYLGSVLVMMGQHTKNDLKFQVEELAGMATFYPQDHCAAIPYLPVYAAGGVQVEFGLVEVQTKKYFRLTSWNVTTPEGSIRIFITAINVFRLLRTMALQLPQDPSTEA